VKKTAPLLVWLLLAVLGGVVVVLFFPRILPLLPRTWKVDRDQAETVALERLRALGDAVEKPYAVVSLNQRAALERRLRMALTEGTEGIADSFLARAVLGWEVVVFPAGAQAKNWTYQAEVSPGGEVTALRLRVEDDEEIGPLDPDRAVERGNEFLRQQGFDLDRFAAPEVRTRQLNNRTDLSLHYRDRTLLLGEEIPHGLEVTFAGDRLTGFQLWLEDPEAQAFLGSFQGYVLAQQIWLFSPVALMLVVGIFFLRRYHAGEIGVHRGVQIFGVSLLCGLVFLVLCASIVAENFDGPVGRRLINWVAGFQLTLFYFLPLAAIALLSWSVGEARCREHRPGVLAGFDALFQGRFGTATVARESFIGLSAGVALSGLIIGSAHLLGNFGVWVPMTVFFGPWWDGSSWPGLALLLLVVPGVLYRELFGRLLLISGMRARFGRVTGTALAVLLVGFLLMPPLLFIPFRAVFPLALVVAAVFAFLFLRHGLLTSVIAGLVEAVLLSLYPFLISGHPWLEFQACLPLLVVALPFLVSARSLFSGEEFTYRWDDVPPHVRRIAERERQRVELETARQIQSSILPELPPQLNGVELAHAYLPATEVGGDFYDVLALEDGRLAVALGDVAGHGVSSGLVMSMARSALAVQVTFNPEVAAVFSTLNRVVYQSARKRLLATLCYAVLDPARREFVYASAGHLYPYLVKGDGRVHPLEFDSYPLGVRVDLQVEARLSRLDSGDTLFLLSDGLVEAHAEGSDDLFGFDRLEQSLTRNAHLGVASLRDAVLKDVDRHSRGAPREDDQTVLVLRVP